MKKHVKLEVDLLMDGDCIDKFVEFIDKSSLDFEMDLISFIDTSEISISQTISIIENSNRNVLHNSKTEDR